MEYELYSIKDVVSGNFSEILIFQNEAMAVRYFLGLCEESKIKNDLQLYKLGTYDSKLGTIVQEVIEYIKGGADV